MFPSLSPTGSSRLGDLIYYIFEIYFYGNYILFLGCIILV